LSSKFDVRTILADEIFTTAGKTALTTGEKVAGIETASRTGGAAAAAAAAGACPAWTIEAPTKAPPANDPRLSKSAAMTHVGYLVIRFMFSLSFKLPKILKPHVQIRRWKDEFVRWETAPEEFEIGRILQVKTRNQEILEWTRHPSVQVQFKFS
jgi:hypothetical protein